MIARDEEKNLENCLNSVKKLVDEIIIVIDTRSKDKTKEIALKFTNKVFDFKWNDNFSEARNFSISKATGNWILVLDADEVIAEKDCIKIRNLSEKDQAEAYYFTWRNYTNNTGVANWISCKNDEYEESKQAAGFSISKYLRFFKNKGYKYTGRIHETIGTSIRKSNGKIFNTNIVIHHFGNLNKEKYASKKENYIELLKKRLEQKDFKEKPEDFICFEIARELTNAGKNKQAIPYLEKAIKINEDIRYLFLLGSLHLVEENYEIAERLLKKALILNPRNASIHNNLGILYAEQKNLHKAVKKFEKAIKLNKRFADAYFNLGTVYYELGKTDNANELFKKAIELNQNYKVRAEEYIKTH